MKKIRIEDAVGQTLCHDMTGISGAKKGVVFSRGHVICQTDIPQLLDIGKSHVFVWDADENEVHESDAALSVAEATCGFGVRHDETTAEGKVLIYSEHPGLFRVNSEALQAINSVGDYTIACLPGMIDVPDAAKLGGIRIVPLVTKREHVDAALRIAEKNHPIFEVLQYKKLKCGVIITGSEVFYGRIEDRFESVMRSKLEKYGAEILGVSKCPDELEKILDAIDTFKEQGAELILLTGGMSVDPDDLTPSAIRASGANVVTHGMPMQPGNMLMLAYLDNTVLIGVPSASMHSIVTSLDVFLPRIFAGIEINPDDFCGLGEGGFCSGCTVCNFPRCYFGRGR
ncbi:MAG: molybdopterin-binding protein [Oscillospiraceae bacterium]|nr:molybdopterin-binding protein [Oscillospiraceae bacterium]